MVAQAQASPEVRVREGGAVAVLWSWKHTINAWSEVERCTGAPL